MSRSNQLAHNWGNAWGYLNILFIFGFAAALTWMSSFYSVAAEDVLPVRITGSLSEDIYAISLLAIIAVQILIAIFPRYALPLIKRRGSICLAISMAISVLILVVPNQLGFTHPAFLIVGTILAGMSSALFLLAWILSFGCMRSRSTFPTLILAYILSSGANVVLQVSATNAIAIISFLLPFLSLLCLLVGRQALSDCDFSRYNPQRDIEGSARGKGRFSKTMLVKLCIAFVIWALVCRLLRVIYNAIIGAGSSSSFVIAHSLAALAVTIIIVALVVTFLANVRRFRFAHIYRLIFLLALASVLFLPFVFFDKGTLFAYIFNEADYQIFCMFMWVIIAGACHNYPCEAIRIYSVVGGFWSIGAFIGTVLGNIFDSSSILGNNILTALAVLALAVCYVLIFTESDAEKLSDIIPSYHRRPFDELCKTIGENYGLTTREREIMELIAKGRDSAYIQQHLFLSRSTVQTHRMHLYQKMEIHNRQELLDIIDQERSSEKET